jgi:threonine synthase
MTVDTHYECTACEHNAPVESPLWRCPQCGGALSLSLGPGLRRDRIQRDERSLWRYAAAIAVDKRVSLGEGCTPLIPGEWDGAPVQFKLEFTMPTGSFKDRGTAVMMSYLAARNVRSILEDSSGNAGASIAHYAAAAGLEATIFVPEAAPRAKIVQIAASGAKVVPIPGTRQDVADAALEASKNIFYASHNWQAYFAEGTKTLAYELWEQLGFRPPDNIVVPLGYGANIVGCDRGFRELERAGEIKRLPRLFGVQAENCAPILAAQDGTAFEARPTVADGIASQKPVRMEEVLGAIRRSGGAVVGAPEAEIVGALRALGRKGLFVEPTSATVGVALSRLLRERRIGRDETTVVVLTGSGLKAATVIGDLLGIGSG